MQWPIAAFCHANDLFRNLVCFIFSQSCNTLMCMYLKKIFIYTLVEIFLYTFNLFSFFSCSVENCISA